MLIICERDGLAVAATAAAAATDCIRIISAAPSPGILESAGYDGS